MRFCELSSVMLRRRPRVMYDKYGSQLPDFQMLGGVLRFLAHLSWSPDGQRMIPRHPDALEALLDLACSSGSQRGLALLVLRNL